MLDSDSLLSAIVMLLIVIGPRYSPGTVLEIKYTLEAKTRVIFFPLMGLVIYL